MTAPAVPDPRLQPRAFLRALFDAAVARAQPAHVIDAFLPAPPRGRTVVLGAGKAAAAMAAAVAARWPGQAPLTGLVVTRHGHVPPGWGRDGDARIALVEAGHPVPDAAGARAARRMLALVRGLTADDLVLCLLSGGGSALLALPAPGLTLAHKQAVHRALVASGAAIDEINTVRKHLSALKGGRLGAACAPAQGVTLLVSDVPGDAPDVIASGPTVPDPSTCADALAVAARYRIRLGAAAREGLASGRFETPKPGDARFASHAVHLLATPRDSLRAAAAVARRAGIAAHLLDDAIEGDARSVGAMHAALARSVARHGEPFEPPCVLLSGGETTVALGRAAPVGQGGRAAVFALGAALALHGEPGVHALAADTDGIDGTGAHAGAFVAPDTLARAQALGLSARQRLDAHDAAGFFAPLGDLLVTGPTFTNVNDFRALLVL